MAGFLKAATIVISGGAIAGYGALAMLHEALSPSSTLFATARIPDPPQAPCTRQVWLNSDRACQSWTLPHRDIQQFLSSEPTPVESPPKRIAASDKRLVIEESATEVRGRTARRTYARARAVRLARVENGGIFRATESTQHGYMYWPTFRNDAIRPGLPQRRNDSTRMFTFFGTSAR
jgi:hypothetical protein